MGSNLLKEFNNLEDLQKNFDGVLVSYKGRAFYTKAKEDGLGLYKILQEGTFSQRATITLPVFDQKDLELDFPTLGFFLGQGGINLYYILRNTHRQWTFGASQKSVTIFQLALQNKGNKVDFTQNRNVNIFHPIFMQQLETRNEEKFKIGFKTQILSYKYAIFEGFLVSDFHTLGTVDTNTGKTKLELEFDDSLVRLDLAKFGLEIV